MPTQLIRISKDNFKELEKMKTDLNKTIEEPSYDNVITLLLKSKKKTPFIIFLKRGRNTSVGTIEATYQKEIQKTIGKQINIDFLFG